MGGIQFGTDGWRSIIADGFTFERVEQVAQLAAYRLAETFQGEGIVVGYDRRFLSEEFALAAAKAIQKAGFHVLLSEGPAPTPAYSWTVVSKGMLGAIVITASHNPPTYSGLKIKGAFGGSVGSEFTQGIEERYVEGGALSEKPGGTLAYFDPWPAYLEQISKKVDLEAIERADIAILMDVMHGVGSGSLRRLLKRPLMELRSERDPLFGGVSPEPIPKNLAPFFKALQEYTGPGTVVGAVLDGDADRVAAGDHAGNYLSCQVLIPLYIDHLVRRKGLTGAVVKTISGSDLMAQVAKARGLKCYETAIGFKYIAEIMLREPVLVGGEESGGVGFIDHMPERDGLLCVLYLLEMVALTGKDLTQLYQELQEELDYHSVYDRIDLKLPNSDLKNKLVSELEKQPFTEVDGLTVTEHLTTDGHRFRLAPGHWLLIRFSGTEPLLRLYCEGPNPERVARTLAWAKDWALSFT